MARVTELRLNSRGLDVSKLKMTQETVDMDGLLEDYAALWLQVEQCKKKLSIKRLVRIYEKALTNPIFPAEKFPLQSPVERELFYTLQLLQDRTVALVELMHQKMTDKNKTKT